MLNVTIYIKDAYPFSDDEVRLIVKALWIMHGVQARYFYPHFAHWAEVDEVTMTAARQIASTIKAIHLFKALKESRPNSRVNAEDVEVEVLGRRDNPPEWAR